LLTTDVEKFNFSPFFSNEHFPEATLVNILQGFGPYPPSAKNQQLGKKWVDNPQNFSCF